MPPLNPIRAASRLSRFEGDPTLNKSKSQEAPRERTNEEIEAQQASINDLYNPGVNPESVSEISETHGVESSPESRGGSVDETSAKIEREAESVRQEVLVSLTGLGLPETSISEDGKASIYRRLYAEIDKVSTSKTETLESSTVGGGILPESSRRTLVRALVSEELMSYYNESPDRAISTLSSETIKEMFSHTPNESPESRVNTDLAQYGERVESLGGGQTLEQEAVSAVNAANAEAVEIARDIELQPPNQLEDVEGEDSEVKEAEKEVVAAFEEMGGDVDRLPEGSVRIDQEIITPNTLGRDYYDTVS